MAEFILASSSPRRRDLLASLGIEFRVVQPAIDESRRPGEAPADYVRRLSMEKAEAVAEALAGPAVILAADTAVIDGDDILDKPADAADARRILRRLRGQEHRVCTAITLYRLAQPPRQLTRLACTRVFMRAYSDEEVAAYIATGDPFDKAGSYAIQHPDFAPVDHIEGSYSNVVGLPLETLREALQEMGWPMEAQALTTDWMWNDDGEVWGLSLNLERRTVEWSDSIGCACGGSIAEQTFADFIANGPRYGRPPDAVLVRP